MKIQLTKTKTIEIGGRGSTAPSDVVGIELTADPQGCPAVRLQRRRNGWRLVAAGFVPPPPGKLPTSWDELDTKATGGWTLPTAFQAPTAAVALDAPTAVARQTTREGIRGELGAAKLMIENDKPFSHEGNRRVAVELSDGEFVLEAGLPEYQVLWLGRLFPEGHRPTVASVQVSTIARLAALATQPELEAAEGSAISVLVTADAVYFTGWSGGRLALLRQCPGTFGWRSVREAVKTALTLDESLVDEVLDGNLVDPCFAMEPFLRPILRELALSVDYMTQRLKVEPGWVYLTGLPSGAGYWNQIASRSSRLSFVVPHAFEGLEIVSKKGSVPELSSSQSQAFLGALGAARALMEDPS